MKLLLDTQVLLWAMAEPAMLSGAARDVLGNIENTALVSAASIWEISIKLKLGKLELAKNWKQAIEKELGEGSMTWLAITREHCVETIELPLLHRDPFDRLLMAQARMEKAAIVTSDKDFQLYEVSVVW